MAVAASSFISVLSMSLAKALSWVSRFAVPDHLHDFGSRWSKNALCLVSILMTGERRRYDDLRECLYNPAKTSGRGVQMGIEEVKIES